jgi:hypothetical protein
MNENRDKKSADYSDLDQEAQEIIRKEVESVITSHSIDWQTFEYVRAGEDKSGPPRYATNEIFDKLEESGILSLKEGYGTYALQAGSLINIGPSRNIFTKYNFREMDELKRYVKACYVESVYPIVSARKESLIPIHDKGSIT